MRIAVLVGVLQASVAVSVAAAQAPSGAVIELRSVAWSPDGATVAIGAYGQTILLDASRRELARVGESTGWHHVSFLPDGRLVTQGDGADSAPSRWRSILWDARTGKRLAVVGAPSACATDPEQAWACRADGTGWRVQYRAWTREVVVERWDGTALTTGWTGGLGRATDRPRLAVSPHGEVASAGKDAYSELATERMLVHADEHTGSGVARRYFYQDSPKHVPGGYVRVHHAGRLRCEATGLGTAIESVGFSPDGKTLLAGDATGAVFVLSSDCKLLRTLRGGGAAAIGVAARADRAVAIARSGTVTWWDLRTGAVIATDTIR